MLKDNVIRDDLGAPFIDGLLDNIQARFQHAEVIEHLAIVDLTGTEELPTLYGLTEMEALAEHFKLDTEKLLGQWEDYNVFAAGFVCVEVLRSSQPNGVMSSAVSLPNHTFTGQA